MLYAFSNGVSIDAAHLMPEQVSRYALPGNPNLHEPVEEEWLLRQSHDSMTFLDVGAGVGYYSILIKKRFPNARVIAVDALTRHVSAMRENMASNGLGPADITIEPVAVAPKAGSVRFIDEGYGSGINWRGHKVPAVTLDSLADRYGPIDVCKIDIQGAEWDVLRASNLARIKRLILGTHGPAIHAKIIGLLAGAWDILCDDPQPPFQPDGLIVAARRIEA